MAIKYLSGNRATGITTDRVGVESYAAKSWVELGRATLSSAGNTIDVTGLSTANYPYLMVLAQTINSGGTTQPRLRFNADTGSNYALRHQRNGAADATDTSANSVYLYDADNTPKFMQIETQNITDQEKMCIGHTVTGGGTAGAGTAPNRQESVFKWANTSDQITSVSINRIYGTGTFATGSEVVVLGSKSSGTDTSKGSFWQELADVSLSSAGDSLDTGTFTAKKYLWVQIKRNRTGAVNSRIQVNGDSGSNYAHRYSGGANSYSESTSTTQTSIYSHAATSNESFTNYFIINKADQEKLMIIEEVNGAAAGAGNAPARAEVVAKWTNTSAQITSIQCINTDSGDLTSGTSIKVWGSD